ncbi:MAG: type II toxin-antitoxin system death-on-curing family toxin [Phycisphaeraceae bacterium]|nr:type II toxin-antitoxin system death-on-curing family toxin [Phycisphaeraceae bacterium]QYK48990.1 MAG: type II toxin-antitoxin system death-on-curing family toxin [Phycisphaeraceae bacterium]
MTPEWLRVDDVLQIHQDQIERYGGSPDLRDPGLLTSAVETPRAMFDGRCLHGDLFEMAAAYLFHIVQNHPFMDGNKRTGTAVALVFLDLNGIEMAIDDDALVDHVLGVAQGRIAKPEIAAFLKEHVVD